MTQTKPNQNESSSNLAWLQTGELYFCTQALPGLHQGQQYKYEAFSSDPLGDTRQYLFHDLDKDDFHGVELSADMPTPIWESHLKRVNSPN